MTEREREREAGRTWSKETEKWWSGDKKEERRREVAKSKINWKANDTRARASRIKIDQEKEEEHEEKEETEKKEGEKRGQVG